MIAQNVLRRAKRGIKNVQVGPFQSILNGGGDLAGFARPNQQRPGIPGLRDHRVPLKPTNKFRPGGENVIVCGRLKFVVTIKNQGRWKELILGAFMYRARLQDVAQEMEGK